MRTTNTLTEQMIEWTGAKGNAIAVRVALTETMTDHDGQLLEMVRERGGLRITVAALVDGKERGAGLTVYAAARSGVAADVGQVVGLNAARLALVQAGIEQVKRAPEWVAKVEADKLADAAARQREQSHERIARAMAE